MTSGWQKTAAALHVALFLGVAGVVQSCAVRGSMEAGLQAAAEGDYEAAVAEWLPLAENGDARASYNVGQLYRTGRGVDRNFERAAYWYRAAADRLHAPAQFNLALLYENGYGVPIDYAAAHRWYRKAAEQGYAPAQFNLAVMYSLGQGTRKDYVQAYLWYGLAAAQGDEEAERNLAVMVRRMTPAQLAEAQELALERLERP